MGASEGTLLAAEATSRVPKEIRGLILNAVLSITLKDALKYMACDGNFLVLCKLFDSNGDRKITREEFEADPHKLLQGAMKGVKFEIDGLDHSLGVLSYFLNGTVSVGHQAIFDFIGAATRVQ